MPITMNLAGLDKIAGDVKTRAQEILDDYANEISVAAKNLAPVKTGYLRRQIDIEAPDPYTRRIGLQDVPYAVFQEFGFHHYITGQFIQNPFLIPALEMYRSKFLAACEGLV